MNDQLEEDYSIEDTMTIERHRKRGVPPRPLIVVDATVLKRPIPSRPATTRVEAIVCCSECGASKHLIREVPSRMADRQIIQFVRYLNGQGWRWGGSGRILCPAHDVQ